MNIKLIANAAAAKSLQVMTVFISLSSCEKTGVRTNQLADIVQLSRHRGNVLCVVTSLQSFYLLLRESRACLTLGVFAPRCSLRNHHRQEALPARIRIGLGVSAVVPIANHCQRSLPKPHSNQCQYLSRCLLSAC